MQTQNIFLELITNINVIFYILAYLVGGIPSGLFLAKIFGNVDVRKVGSGSIGATNVYRALKDVIDPRKAKIISIFTLISDALKGLVVVLLAKIFGLGYETQWMIAILCVLAHCYSPYLNFTGGKGVSTAIGSVILLMPIEGILGLIVWAVVGKVFKVSSLSSLLGVLSGIGFTFIIPYVLPLPHSISIIDEIGTHTPVVVIAIIILYTHIPNIIRLLKGQEKKVL
ncbi:glycerol-3-phosphate 1-O-acyltransferase PlsY [Helicobacter cappadocius]|uniref:Glycerol-3-phosphate acyltransferase n=1 Tax=Helicobacter cappadocius TaxID=3063998 RepID=A0AA90T908_9HELI|nr:MULTISPECIES: glycerol-3-phosphate 1-O-acyltransferase PlsY [unclassified Helicobacter]MDO7252490.1 glycerol-3-phosphate 1-O-acyltransferase PlsY [Helicobacter sp. faydin-H75]MDP2538357.1 glycerol-3-phosphate 1-O-acyltransferase PlsY [Helicobacter sp. faydin-H76]